SAAQAHRIQALGNVRCSGDRGHQESRRCRGAHAICEFPGNACSLGKHPNVSEGKRAHRRGEGPLSNWATSRSASVARARRCRGGKERCAWARQQLAVHSYFGCSLALLLLACRVPGCPGLECCDVICYLLYLENLGSRISPAHGALARRE